VDELIDLLIDAPELSYKLKTIASKFRSEPNLQFYTDGFLQKDSRNIDSMGFG